VWCCGVKLRSDVLNTLYHKGTSEPRMQWLSSLSADKWRIISCILLGLTVNVTTYGPQQQLFTRYCMDFVIFRYQFHLQKAQHVVIDSNLSLAAVVMFGIFSCRIVDVWNSLSDTVVKSTSVASFKNNLGDVDLSRFLTVV